MGTFITTREASSWDMGAAAAAAVVALTLTVALALD
jgi:hypothetical protein